VNRSSRNCVIATYSKRPDGGLRVKLDQDIDVARALAVATRDETEQRGVANPAPMQFGLVSAQRGDDSFPVDASSLAGLMPDPFDPHLRSFRHPACL
jgi:hypothetical protein